MNPSPLTFWDRAQLALLRLLSVILGLLDQLFQVDWGERVLERMSRRWEARLQQLNEALTEIEQERDHLQDQSEAMAIHAAAVYLATRHATHGRLRFDPAVAHDNEILDATIDLLVKQRLASIETEEVEAGRFVYTVEPDWEAILAGLGAAADQADPEVAKWFQDGIRFIGETLLSQAEPSDDHQPTNPNEE